MKIDSDREKIRKKGNKITDLAGTWDMTDEEAIEIKASIVQAWKETKIKPANFDKPKEN